MSDELMKRFDSLNKRVVKHFKREMLSESELTKNPSKYLYYVSGKALHTETGELLVIYISLEDEQTYARPAEMFLGRVDSIKYPNIKQKYRFEPL